MLNRQEYDAGFRGRARHRKWSKLQTWEHAPWHRIARFHRHIASNLIQLGKPQKGTATRYRLKAVVPPYKVKKAHATRIPIFVYRFAESKGALPAGRCASPPRTLSLLDRGLVSVSRRHGLEAGLIGASAKTRMFWGDDRTLACKTKRGCSDQEKCSHEFRFSIRR